MKFQSLFSWNGRFHPESVKSVSLPLPVSILVFLEWALSQRQKNWEFRRAWVSILVFLEWALSLILKLFWTNMAAKFQSLFSWNGRFHWHLIRKSDLQKIVSILVFLEWALSQDCILYDELMKLRSFNPCFLGMGAFTKIFSNSSVNWNGVSILVFLEWALSLKLNISLTWWMLKFQSLFSWNGRFHTYS